MHSSRYLFREFILYRTAPRYNKIIVSHFFVPVYSDLCRGGARCAVPPCSAAV